MLQVPESEDPSTEKAELEGSEPIQAQTSEDESTPGEGGEGEEPTDAASAEAEPAEAAGEAEEDKPEKLGPGEKLDDETLKSDIATLLFASPDPISLSRLIQLLQRPERSRVQGLVASLAEDLATSPFPIVIREIQGGFRLFTDPDQAEIVARLRATPKPEKISAAALETLAIVAYRQPVTKAEIEAIRGVQAGPMLRTLVDRALIRVTGRAEQPGSPLQYGTTRDFLDRFGLSRVKDLPRDAELAGD